MTRTDRGDSSGLTESFCPKGCDVIKAKEPRTQEATGHYDPPKENTLLAGLGRMSAEAKETEKEPDPFEKAWKKIKGRPQKGDEHRKIPSHLHDTPLHEEGLHQLSRGMTVDWGDGNVNHPDMSIALYNLYDHYDMETGQPIERGGGK